MSIEICSIGGFTRTEGNSVAIKVDDEVVLLDEIGNPIENDRTLSPQYHLLPVCEKLPRPNGPFIGEHAKGVTLLQKRDAW